MCRSFRPRAASPAPFLEQPLHILPSCSHQCFTVHLPELSQAKAPHAMPILALGKYRFHPDAALAHGLLIRLGPMVGADSLQILLIETASEGSTAPTVRAVCFERAGIAHGMGNELYLSTYCVGKVMVPSWSSIARMSSANQAPAIFPSRIV